MSELKISVITPSYNQGEFIEDTINSVLAQKYKNFEHIIIDGGSTDDTLKILNKYTHLKWISEKDKGQSNALNKGFKMAKGDIICWINSDDTLEQGTFKKVNAFFQKKKKFDMVEGGINIIGRKGNKIKYIPPRRISVDSLLNKMKSVNQQATFFKRNLLVKYGYLDEKIHCCMDHDLFVRFLINGCKVGILNEPLANFRIYETTKTSTLAKIFIKDKLYINKKYGGQKLNSEKLKMYVYLWFILPIKKIKLVYGIYKWIKKCNMKKN
jgi:glycosyltransferase involved in cell wall biosynthesis